ncbi:uncharacterized protein LY89DRAFT_672672 [Mollisia scopiformis]|uniref:Uncharacterized protein n=1 Tax=Mollisia scopiformis TaxID=149040 RepID=A0A194X0H6_MOLSC|nr:uncharacterized protein LY89DRAFT_672672 [Mollisia scopiformis]KUJ13459.1 hypothetical protein LY89DRAFT_672672 [Mollisia scopiformis]
MQPLHTFTFALLLPTLIVGLKLARHLDNPLSPRSIVYLCGPNPVDCGGGYCCDMYEVCAPLPSGLYQCLTPGLTVTNDDGSTITMTAEDPHSENVWWSSLAAEESSWGETVSYDSYAELTTAGESSPTGGSNLTSSSPTVTSFPPTATSTAPIIVPASTTLKSSGSRKIASWRARSLARLTNVWHWNFGKDVAQQKAAEKDFDVEQETSSHSS